MYKILYCSLYIHLKNSYFETFFDALYSHKQNKSFDFEKDRVNHICTRYLEKKSRKQS